METIVSSSTPNFERFPLVDLSIQHTLYVKAYPLTERSDVDKIKAELIQGNILIVKITPIAARSEEETKLAISELVEFTNSIQGDIARLEEERIVLTPPTARVWRGKSAEGATSLRVR